MLFERDEGLKYFIKMKLSFFVWIKNMLLHCPHGGHKGPSVALI